MVQIPQLKKKISAFLTKEDGKISKENLIKAGVLLSAAAIVSLKSTGADNSCPLHDPASHSAHCNQAGLIPNGATAAGSHSHSHGSHASHSSHGSHASHGSHGSHCSW